MEHSNWRCGRPGIYAIVLLFARFNTESIFGRTNGNQTHHSYSLSFACIIDSCQFCWCIFYAHPKSKSMQMLQEEITMDGKLWNQFTQNILLKYNFQFDCTNCTCLERLLQGNLMELLQFEMKHSYWKLCNQITKV